MGEFSPPVFLNHADAQTSNTSTRLWFYYIITKIHPPFQNPGSAPEFVCIFLICFIQWIHIIKVFYNSNTQRRLN